MKRIIFTVLALVVISGCAGTAVDFDISIERAPRGPYDVVAIGVYFGDRAPIRGFRTYPVDSEDKLHFRRRLVEALRESKAFTDVLDPSPALLPASALLLAADIRMTRGGWHTYSTLFGGGGNYWEGRHVGAQVVLRDSKGTHLAVFEISDGEFGRLADEAAAAIVRWSQGEGLKGHGTLRE